MYDEEDNRQEERRAKDLRLSYLYRGNESVKLHSNFAYAFSLRWPASLLRL